MKELVLQLDIPEFHIYAVDSSIPVTYILQEEKIKSYKSRILILGAEP